MYVWANPAVSVRNRCIVEGCQVFRINGFRKAQGFRTGDKKETNSIFHLRFEVVSHTRVPRKTQQIRHIKLQKIESDD